MTWCRRMLYRLFGWMFAPPAPHRVPFEEEHNWHPLPADDWADR